MAQVQDGEGIRKRLGRRNHCVPTLADVAREAGVSPMTVSRTINGQVRVLGDTRERVWAAVQKLGYVPNAAARSLAGARSCRIALVYDNPSAAWLSDVLVGCLAEAADQDAQLLVEQCGDGESDTLLQRLIAHRVDAVVLPPPLCDDVKILSILRAAGLPVVQLAAGMPADNAFAVFIDNQAAAQLMTRHLVSLGHGRIGFIEGNPNQTASTLRRLGYETALREAGIALDPSLIVPGDFSYRSGVAAAKLLLNLADRPTAIFASNDDMAAATVAVAHWLGLAVPDALTVCGFDDTAVATAIVPEVTTIRQPVHEMARLAASLAVAAARDCASHGVPSVRHMHLDFALVRRGSDAQPNRSRTMPGVPASAGRLM